MELSKRSYIQDTPQQTDSSSVPGDLPNHEFKQNITKSPDQASDAEPDAASALQTFTDIDKKIDDIINVFTKPDKDTELKTVEWKGRLQTLIEKLQKHLDEITKD